jgi:hypothetical protein
MGLPLARPVDTLLRSAADLKGIPMHIFLQMHAYSCGYDRSPVRVNKEKVLHLDAAGSQCDGRGASYLQKPVRNDGCATFVRC